ncbi:11623_t:CDS:2 [Funneliformis mosseae]|uniref:11623_t:CDS:1 n=1 Tax=Funneliformis mosseae TaxID=27381 RepID=A0A9N9A530_FUNMO|nr:11623_t:CDS:2 [Funneliformis mosseae]
MNPIKHYEIIEISPKGECIAAYSKKNKVIDWYWYVDVDNNENDANENEKDNNEKDDNEKDDAATFLLVDGDLNYKLRQSVYAYGDTISAMCVSDQMKIAYIQDNYFIRIIDMKNIYQEKKLKLNFEVSEVQHCNFNLEGDLIFSCTVDGFNGLENIVCIYSIQTKTNKTKWKRFFKISDGADVINISKYNKILLRLNDNIYEWDVLMGHTTIITKSIYEEYTCLKLDNIIVVYSNELSFPIAKFNLKNEEKQKQLHVFDIKRPNLRCLLLSLFDNALLESMIVDSNDSIEAKEVEFVKPKNDYDHLTFSEIGDDLGREYQLEKGSIIWKIEEKQKIKVNNEDTKRKNIKGEITQYVRDFDKKINRYINLVQKVKREKEDISNKLDEFVSKIIELRLNLMQLSKHLVDEIIQIEGLDKELSNWKIITGKIVFDQVDKIDKIDEQNISLVEQLQNDFIYGINNLSEELNKNLCKQKKHNIKSKLEKLFINQITHLNNFESDDEKQIKFNNIVEDFTRKIKINEFEDLEVSNIITKYITNFTNLTIDFEDGIDEEIKKLKTIYETFKNIISNINKPLIDKIINSNANDPTRETHIRTIVNEIEINKRNTFVASFITGIEEIKIKGLEKDFINKEIRMPDIDDSDLEKYHIKESSSTTKDMFIRIKENFFKEIKEIDEEESNKQKEKIETSVNNFVKMIIKIGLLKNFNEQTKQGNKSEELIKKLMENVTNFKDLLDDLNKFKNIIVIDEGEDSLKKSREKFKNLVNNFIEEIEIIKIKGLENDLIENILKEEDLNETKLIDLVRTFTVDFALAKKTIERSETKFKKRITEQIAAKNLDSKIIKPIVKKFILVIEEINIAKFEKQLNSFIEEKSIKEKIYNEKPNKIEESNVNALVNSFIEKLTNDKGTSEIGTDKYKKSVDKFIDLLEITKCKKLEEVLTKAIKKSINKVPTEKIDAKQIENELKKALKKLVEGEDFIVDIEEITKDFIEWIKKMNTVEFKEPIAIQIKNLVNTYIKDKNLAKIEDELANYFIKQLDKFKELENDDDKWTSKIKELMIHFTKRIMTVEDLANENRLKIKISKDDLSIDENLIRFFCSDKMYLEILKNNTEDTMKDLNILASKLLNDDSIILLTKIGIFIFHLNKDVRLCTSKGERLISLNYFHPMHDPEGKIKRIKETFGYKIEFDELIYGTISHIKENNEYFLKYGTALLMFAIEEHDVDLIENIYKKCLNAFNEDFEENKSFLSIITRSMPLLNKHYPEFVERFSSNTRMITDSYDYKIDHLNTPHLHHFSDIEIVDLTGSIYWHSYNYRITQQMEGKSIFPENLNPTITFMNPYIKFVSYPQKDGRRWWLSDFFKPTPSPFVKTISSAIYNTWNGEALVNFKWNKYGFYYYIVIWTMFNILLVCFIVATTFSDHYISEGFRNQLLIASIILGFFHSTVEFRQVIYDGGECYVQIQEDGTIAPGQILTQQPDSNTNMFTDYDTAIFSTYLFLTGDSSAFSNWEYKNNTSLAILMFLFSLTIAVYLMNLLIGLLSNAIEKDNNRASYFKQKAKKEWDSNEFPELKQKLLTKLNIQENSEEELLSIVIERTYKQIFDKNKKDSENSQS